MLTSRPAVFGHTASEGKAAAAVPPPAATVYSLDLGASALKAQSGARARR